MPAYKAKQQTEPATQVRPALIKYCKFGYYLIFYSVPCGASAH